MTKYITATQARKNFFKLMELLRHSGITVMVTHQDKPPVVMMSAEEWEGWMETLDILSDPKLVKGIKKAEKEIERGDVVSWKDVKSELNL
jgi:prevent-host-death family protein